MDRNKNIPGLNLPLPSLPSLPIEPLIDAVPPEKRRLGLFLLVTALLHLLAFSLFKIAYPQPMPKSAPRIHVTLANVPGALASIRNNSSFWYDVKDPSLLIRQQQPLVQADPIQISLFPHSSTATARPAARPANKDESIAFLPDDIAPISDRVSGMLDTPRSTFSYTVPKAAAKPPATVLSFEPTLAERIIPPVPVLPNQPSGLITEAGITVVRLAIDSDGRIVHALVEQRSGKDTVDATALQYLRKMRFTPVTKSGLVWGQVTVYWQFEAEKAAPTPTASPAPAQP